MSPMPDDPFYGSHGPMPVDKNGDGPMVGRDADKMFAVQCWCGKPGCHWIRMLYELAPPVTRTYYD